MGTFPAILLVIVAFIVSATWLQSIGIAPEIIWPIFIVAAIVSIFLTLLTALRWPIIIAPILIGYWFFAFENAGRDVMLPALAISAALFLLLGVPHLLRQRRQRRAKKAREAKQRLS